MVSKEWLLSKENCSQSVTSYETPVEKTESENDEDKDKKGSKKVTAYKFIDRDMLKKLAKEENNK